MAYGNQASTISGGMSEEDLLLSDRRTFRCGLCSLALLILICKLTLCDGLSHVDTIERLNLSELGQDKPALVI